MRVTPNCDPLGSPFYISRANYVQWSPDITFGAGNYFVVWSDRRIGSYYYIYGARVTPAGSVLEPSGIQIGRNTGTISQYYPAVAFNGSRYFAVWTYTASPFGITGRFITTNGQAAETTRVCETGTSFARTVRLASSGSNFLVGWCEYSGGTYNIKGQLVSSSGSLIGSPFTVASGTIQGNSLGLCFDGTNYCVTYSFRSGSYYQVWGRKYNTSGQPVGNAFQVSTTTYNHYYCDVTPGANNRYLNVWSEYRSSNYDIYGNVDILMTDVEEQGFARKSDITLKSSLVRDMIELKGAEGREASIFDASGRQVGVVRNGRYDCRHLENGIYFIKVSTGERFKVIKIR